MISIQNAATRKRICFILAFLACWAPRFQSTLKIASVFSFFSIFTVIVYVIFVRRVTLYKTIGGFTFLIWLLLTLLSVWRTVNLGQWMNYFYWTAIAFMNYQIIMHFAQKCETYEQKIDIFSAVIFGFYLSMIVHLLLGFVEIRTGHYLFYVYQRQAAIRRPVSLFYNTNDYATYIVTCIPFAIYHFYHSKKIIGKVFSIFAVGLSIYVILVGNCRGAILAILLIVAIIMYLFCRKSTKNLFIGLFIILVVLGIILINDNLRKQLISLISQQGVDLTTNNDIARYNLIRNGFYFLEKTHGMGVGAGNLHYWLTEKFKYNIFGLGFMHNWFMEIAVTYGVPFFLLYFIFHISSALKLLKSFDRDDKFWTLNNTLLASFVGFTIVSVSSSSNMYSEWVWLYLVVISTYCSIFSKNLVHSRISL